MQHIHATKQSWWLSLLSIESLGSSHCQKSTIKHFRTVELQRWLAIEPRHQVFLNESVLKLEVVCIFGWSDLIIVLELVTSFPHPVWLRQAGTVAHLSSCYLLSGSHMAALCPTFSLNFPEVEPQLSCYAPPGAQQTCNNFGPEISCCKYWKWEFHWSCWHPRWVLSVALHQLIISQVSLETLQPNPQTFPKDSTASERQQGTHGFQESGCSKVGPLTLVCMVQLVEKGWPFVLCTFEFQNLKICLKGDRGHLGHLSVEAGLSRAPRQICWHFSQQPGPWVSGGPVLSVSLVRPRVS